MSVNEFETSIGVIQERTIDEIMQRIQSGRFIPGFLLDTLTRIHPIEISDYTGVGLSIPGTLSSEEFENLDADKAWSPIGITVMPTVASYKEPENLSLGVSVHPKIIEDTDPKLVLLKVGAQRRGLKKWYDYTGPIVSRELLDGTGDYLSPREAAISMLDYHDQTVQECTEIRESFLDITSRVNQPELVVCIPVACGEERDTLPKTLDLLASQSLDFDRYEIVLLHNIRLAPDENGELGVSSLIDNMETIDIVNEELEWARSMYEELLEKYPELKIRVDFEIHRPHVRIGYCRAQIGEAVAERYIERGATNNPLLLNMDADVVSLNSNFLEELINTAEREKASVVAAILKWADPENIVRLDSLTSKLLRLDRFINGIRSRHFKEADYCDSGTAIRLKEYCMVGGQYWRADFAENIGIIKTIEGLSERPKDAEPIVVASKGSVVGSNLRRQIDVMARGFPPNKTWARSVTTFGKTDDQVRLQEIPYYEAEKNAKKELLEWTKQAIVGTLGELDSEIVVENKEAIRKGLKIIGLPDIFEIEEALESALG